VGEAAEYPAHLLLVYLAGQPELVVGGPATPPARRLTAAYVEQVIVPGVARAGGARR
jgi:hypothetical protein